MGIFGSLIAANAQENAARYSANMQLKATRETNETNERLAREQNAWNREQWELENRYNHPAQQAARLRQAGLSQAAAANSIDGGNASPLQSADLSVHQAPGSLPVADMSALQGVDFSSALNTMRQIAQLGLDTQALERGEQYNQQFPEFLLTDLDKNKANAARAWQQYDQSEKTFPHSLRALKYEADAAEKLPDRVASEIKLNQAQDQMINENVRLARQKFNFLEKKNPEEIKQICEKTKQIMAETDYTNKKASLVEDERANIQADTQNKLSSSELNIASAKNVSEKTKQEEIETLWKQFGAPDDVATKIGILVADGKLNTSLLDNAILGTKDYIEQGHRWFGASPVTRPFLYYVFDRGTATEFQLHPGQMGYGIKGLNAITGR